MKEFVGPKMDFHPWKEELMGGETFCTLTFLSENNYSKNDWDFSKLNMTPRMGLRLSKIRKRRDLML